MYFQRAGTHEFANKGILIHFAREVNTFVYFYIIFQ